MLSFFRKGGAGQYVVAAVVFAVMAVFVLEFRAGRGAKGASLTSECGIEVARRCVSAKEFVAAQGLLSPPNIEPKQLKQLNLQKRAMDGLIERELLLMEAERLGLSVSEEATDVELSQGRVRASLPASGLAYAARSLAMCQPDSMGFGCMPGTEGIRLLPVKSSKTGKFDYDIYSRVIRNRTNRSPREFKQMQQRELIAQRMRDLVMSRVQLSENEAFEQFKRARSTVSANAVELDEGWFQRFVVNAPADVLDAWGNEHKAEVDEAWKTAQADFKAGCPLVIQITASFGASATDDDKVLLRERLATAQGMLKGGATFERVAQQLADSADPAAGAPSCLGDSAPAELKKASEGLAVGAVSDVIETADGFHLIKNLGVLAAADVEKVGRSAMARKLALPAIAKEAVATASQTIVERLKAGTSLEDAVEALVKEWVSAEPKKTLAPAAAKSEEEPLALADKAHPVVRAIGGFSANSHPLPNALPGETFVARAFAAEPGAHLEVGLRGGKAIVVVTGKDIATKEAFDKDKAFILRQLLAAKQQEALVRYLAELRKPLERKIKILPELVEKPESERDEG